MTGLSWFKFVTTLILVIEKIESDDKTKYNSFYSDSKAEITNNESDINDVFESVYATTISNTQKPLIKGLICIIHSVIKHDTNISKYNHLAGSSYINITKELDHPSKV